MIGDDRREAERLAELADERDARYFINGARSSGARILAREDREAFAAELARASLLGPSWHAFLDDFAALRAIP
jgi:molybdate-binding protein